MGCMAMIEASEEGGLAARCTCATSTNPPRLLLNERRVQHCQTALPTSNKHRAHQPLSHPILPWGPQDAGQV